jgi:glyoxylase-like metal-dependent hydrolase (beta-lactamase superfamily II)
MPESNAGSGPSRSEAYAVGRVAARRLVEWTGQLFTRGQVFPNSDRDEWNAARSWLEPRFWNSDTDDITVAIQSFLLESDGRLVLVDTGIGNRKQRLNVPQFHNRDTPFLDRLREAGAEPADIDVVVCTHLHPDHVGWNTVLDGNTWVPTFPNARYLLPRADYDFWNPANGSALVGPHAEDHVRVFDDSIQPVVQAGQAELWTGSLRIDDALSLEQVPGHTPGSAVLTVCSQDETALFVGDLLATPMMIGQPDLCAQTGGRSIDQDPQQVVRARHEVMSRAATTGARVVPAHFDADAGIYIDIDGVAFTFVLARPDR